MNSACIAAAASSAEACCSVEFVFRRNRGPGAASPMEAWEEFSVIEELGVRTKKTLSGKEEGSEG